MEQIRINMPEHVKEIIGVLEMAGFEAYAVGGCVRDALLCREPSDWDITTSALPGQVKELFSHTIDTGIQHGTVTVMLDRCGYEVTTYRIDGAYEDSRHPNSVSFTQNLVEDLRRRDFTINAMACNDRSGLVDVFGGMEDLKGGIIRCVGNAEERFTEDALRLLRGVRFSAQLGFEIEEHTKEAMVKLAEGLSHISAERIQMELVKLVTSNHPENLRIAWETGMTGVFLPEFDACMAQEQKCPYHIYSVGEHTLKGMEAVEPEKVLRLAMLFHDFGKPLTWSRGEDGTDHFYGHGEVGAEIAGEVMHRLKFDNDTLDQVRKLTRFHDLRITNTPNRVRRAMNKVGTDLFPKFLKVRRADILAQNPEIWEEELKKLEELEKLYEEVLEKEECVSLKNLAVNGKDLLEAGIPQGKMLGKILNDLLEIVIEEPEKNVPETLLSLAEKMNRK